MYGFYKNINEEQLDRFGNVETLSITKDKIKFSNWDFAYRIKSIENKKETWIITGEGPFEETAITFKSIDENTIEYIENDDNSVRKFIKITKEEFNKL